jgi:hypothetical protein
LYLGFSECSGSYGFILLSRPQGIGRLRQMSQKTSCKQNREVNCTAV